MTVGALTPSKSYTENGVTVSFAVPFRYLAADDLAVSRVVGGVETTLTYGVDWSATTGPTDAGGTLTLASTTAGATLKIRRATARTQQTDYATGDSFPADSHEAALDRLTLIVQEQDVLVSDLSLRALLAPLGETIGVLPTKASRLGKGLAFDAVTGDPVAVDLPAAAQAAAAASAASALAAQLAAEAARDATLTAYDQFDDRYLGAKAANPTVDNDGNALVAGALYYNTTASEMRIWTGSAWVAAYVSGTGFVSKTGDTMTGRLVTVATSASEAGLQVPHGTAPSSPVNGDLWTTSSGLFVRINAVTRQVVTRDATETLTNKTIGSGIFTGTIALNGSQRSASQTVAAADIDCSLGNFFKRTVNGNVTFTFSNPPASGNDFLFMLTITHTSGTITWPGSVSWAGGSAPSLSTGKVHRFIFHTNDGGSTWGGAAQVNY